MNYCIKTDTAGIFQTNSGENIAPDCQARWRPRHAFRLPPRDSKRVGKFTADAGARREALDMYPRERRKQADTAKSPTLFERNAWRICTVNGTMPVNTKEFVLHPFAPDAPSL